MRDQRHCRNVLEQGEKPSPQAVILLFHAEKSSIRDLFRVGSDE